MVERRRGSTGEVSACSLRALHGAHSSLELFCMLYEKEKILMRAESRLEARDIIEKMRDLCDRLRLDEGSEREDDTNSVNSSPRRRESISVSRRVSMQDDLLVKGSRRRSSSRPLQEWQRMALLQQPPSSKKMQKVVEEVSNRELNSEEGRKKKECDERQQTSETSTSPASQAPKRLGLGYPVPVKPVVKDERRTSLRTAMIAVKFMAKPKKIVPETILPSPKQQRQKNNMGILRHTISSFKGAAMSSARKMSISLRSGSLSESIDEALSSNKPKPTRKTQRMKRDSVVTAREFQNMTIEEEETEWRLQKFFIKIVSLLRNLGNGSTILNLMRGYVVLAAPLVAAFRYFDGPDTKWLASNLIAENRILIHYARTQYLLNLHADRADGQERKDALNEDSASSSTLDLVFAAPAWTIDCILLHISAFSIIQPYIRAATAAWKIAQGIRLLHTFATSSEHYFGTSLDLDPIVLRICKLALVFLVVIHYVSCTYHLVGRRFSSQDDRQLGLWAFYATNGSSTAVYKRWSQSYFWAIAVILGNNLAPNTSLSVTFHILVFVIGTLMTATITGSITSLLANADVAATQRRQKMARIRRYLRVYNVPDELASTIRGYYYYLWSATYNDDQLFDDMTDSLRLRLTIATKRRFIVNCNVFKSLDQNTVIRVLMSLKQKICCPNEIVMAQGDFGDAMYFVSKGTLSVLVTANAENNSSGDNPDTSTANQRSDVSTPNATSSALENVKQIKVGTLKPFDHFGEAALTSKGRRTATVQADDFCELFSLDREVLEENSENHAIRELIQSQANRRRLITDVSISLHRLQIKCVCVAAFYSLLVHVRRRRQESKVELPQKLSSSSSKGQNKSIIATTVDRIRNTSLSAGRPMSTSSSFAAPSRLLSGTAYAVRPQKTGASPKSNTSSPSKRNSGGISSSASGSISSMMPFNKKSSTPSKKAMTSTQEKDEEANAHSPSIQVAALFPSADGSPRSHRALNDHREDDEEDTYYLDGEEEKKIDDIEEVRRNKKEPDIS